MREDLCARLRSDYPGRLTITHEAADEIERLRKVNNAFEVALAEYRAWCDTEGVTEHRAWSALEKMT